MNEYHFRLIGKALAFTGTVILISPILMPHLTSWSAHPSIYRIYDVFLLLGIICACSGVIILRTFKEMRPYLVKAGEPIHSGRAWKKESESGLFLTSCERVVSTNLESRETLDVGYRLVSAEGPTCRDCSMRAGRVLLESFGKHRSY